MYNVINYVSPIPFYASAESRDYMNEYAFGVTYHNIILTDAINTHLPSFLVHTTIPAVLASSVSCLLRSQANPQNTWVLPSASLLLLQDAGLSTILFTETPIAVIPQGAYTIELYVALTNGTTEAFYSDLLFNTTSIQNYVKLEWHNPEDLSISGRIIPFTKGFRPSCYVDSHIGKPEYKYEETSTTRIGYEFIESVLSKKTYRFVFVAPEYLCDAMRLMKLCYFKFITRYDFPNFGTNYKPMNMSLEVEWEEQGNLAGVTCTFDIDNILSNIGGFLPGNGDFNNDYSNDFSNF